MLLQGLALALLCALVPATGLAQDHRKPLPAIEGKLVDTGAGCPILKVQGKLQPLSGKTSHVLHTLQDPRLDGRELRLEGVPKPDGSFEVEWIFSVHDGKVFRIRYFCKLCNIEALEPGPCACCQQPTELEEVPLDGPTP